MHVIGPVVLSLVGVGLVTAISAALYASLPRSFLEYAELHGRFHGLRQEELIAKGTPAEAMPEGALSAQTA
jgi:hypothetical protein